MRTGIMRAGTVAAVLLGCRSRPSGATAAPADAFLATRVPVARLDSVLAASDSVRLSLADARTLLAVAQDVRLELGLPRDTMTIAEILAWTRAEQARHPAGAGATPVDRAHEVQVARQLDSLLTVTVVSKRFLPKDPDAERYQDYIELTFAYRNRGTKPISAFQGDVAFVDTFGDTVYSAHLKTDQPLRPRQTRREPGRIIRYDPTRPQHQRLRDTPLTKLKVVWQPSEVIFTDGSRLALAEP